MPDHALIGRSLDPLCNDGEMMTDMQLLRYSRQILLPSIGAEGQHRLARSRVLLIGLGGLGSPVALYLAAAGIGRLVLADSDHVDLTNLQRQILYTTRDIDSSKAQVASQRLMMLNPHVEAVPLRARLDGEELLHQVGLADIVIDATDNFATRFAINDACVRLRKPLVSGAAIRLEGTVGVYRLDRDDAPCYRCVFGAATEPAASCNDSGVLGPVVGMIGSIQAIEAIKLLLGISDGLAGRMLMIDALSMCWRSVSLRKNRHCPVCATGSSV